MVCAREVKVISTSLLVSVLAVAGLMPNVRVDCVDDPHGGCANAAITLGPGTGFSQPVYVVFEHYSSHMDSGYLAFQKSTDAGRTWLPASVFVARVFWPDVATDRDGDIYVVGEQGGKRIYCVKSTDGGATWSEPVPISDTVAAIGWARIVADSAGRLFCAWNDWRTGSGHIWSSVSTDRGLTWSRSVRVCDDTTNNWCYQPDVFVQPGTNHYLVAAEVPRPDGPEGCYLYRSTDMGQTFQPGVRLDTFVSYAGGPHVVADAQHIICNYTGGDAEARTCYTQPDTWGAPHSTGYSYGRGAKLAISADGYVHTVLMAGHDGTFDTYYTFSTDHGVSWADPELANEDTVTESYDPDIAADSAGHVYIAWRKGSVQHGEIWLATNNPAAIVEQPIERGNGGTKAHAVTVRNGARIEYQLPTSARVHAALHDAVGRRVCILDAGEQEAGPHQLSWNRDNEGRRLSAGTYFVLLSTGAQQFRLKAVVR
jgi:hypothetical protein